MRNPDIYIRLVLLGVFLILGSLGLGLWFFGTPLIGGMVFCIVGDIILVESVRYTRLRLREANTEEERRFVREMRRDDLWYGIVIVAGNIMFAWFFIKDHLLK